MALALSPLGVSPKNSTNPASQTNTEAETARTGDVVLDNNLILLDSEILKRHKDPNFDRLAKSIEISIRTASFHVRSRSRFSRVSSARAQAPPGSAQSRAELFGRQAYPGASATPGAETEGYAVTSPSDKDIGEQQILKRVEEYKPFTISIYSPFFWTSNAALVSKGAQDECVRRAGREL